MQSRMFAAWAVAIAGVVTAQSVAHLLLVLDADRIGTLVDLDRSNGLPDVVSTAVLAIATVGAGVLSRTEAGHRRLVSECTGGALAALTLADLLHDGAHPSRSTGPLVITLVAFTIALIALVGARGSTRVRVTLAVAICFLAASFLITGLDRFDQWFERERGDLVAELEIVAKEALELAGWALVALALWDRALTFRPRRSARERASAQALEPPSRR